jgi:hypothetical protein
MVVIVLALAHKPATLPTSNLLTDLQQAFSVTKSVTSGIHRPSRVIAQDQSDKQLSLRATQK